MPRSTQRSWQLFAVILVGVELAFLTARSVMIIGFVPSPKTCRAYGRLKHCRPFKLEGYPEIARHGEFPSSAAGDDGGGSSFLLASICASALFLASVAAGGNLAKAELGSLGQSSSPSVIALGNPESSPLQEKKTAEPEAEKAESPVDSPILRVLGKLKSEAANSIKDVVESPRDDLPIIRVLDKLKSEAASNIKEDAKSLPDDSPIIRVLDKLKSEAASSIKEIVNGQNKVEKAALRELRSIGEVFDKMQSDIYSESWVTLSTYSPMIRAYSPLFDYYADTVYPPNFDDDKTVNTPLRFALLYEVETIFAGLNDFEEAVQRKDVRDSEKAFADMSLAYDRYLKAGNLQAGYDPVASTEALYSKIDDRQLSYKRLSLQQPLVRDKVQVIQGSDKGKLGTLIWLRENQEGKAVTAIVKLAANPNLAKDVPDVKEVKIFPYTWIACTKSVTFTPLDDFAAATLAAIFSATLTCPIDTLKVRQQAGLPPIPKSGLLGLFDGLPSNLGQYCIPGGIFLAGSNTLADYLVDLPFIDGNNPDLKLFLLIPAGILANTITLPIRQPFEEMNKLVMTGIAKGELEAFQKLFIERPAGETWLQSSTGVVIQLVRGVPFGALQVTTYEIFKEKLVVPYEVAGLPIGLEAFAWGALSGGVTGFLTNPPDVIMTRTIAGMEASGSSRSGKAQNGVDVGAIVTRIVTAAQDINRKGGLGAFFVGAESRTVYLALEAMLWFAGYERLKDVFEYLHTV